MLTKNPHLRLSVTAVISASMLLTACQFGAPQNPSDNGTTDAGQDTSQVRSNAEGGQGGAVVSSDNEGNPNSDHPNASKKTSFDDLWMLDSIIDGNDNAIMNNNDVLYYGVTYEIVCALQLAKDGSENIFVGCFPGTDLTGTWTEDSETEATLTVPLSDTESQTGKMEMSSDYQTATLTMPGENGTKVVYRLHRDDDVTLDPTNMYQTMIKNNDDFFEGLPIDTPLEAVIADDDKVLIKLIGTTHSEAQGTSGYLLEILNRTDSPLIVNDFVGTENGPSFKVNGSQNGVPAITGRVLPPVLTDEQTGQHRAATMRCAVLFSDKVTGGKLTGCSGDLVITDYHWNEVGRYQFTV